MIQKYDTAHLKDGRTGAVVEVFGDDEILIDVGSPPKDRETISVTSEEIDAVIEK